MSRERQRLSAQEVAKKKRPGNHLDGAGLYLQVRESDGGGVTKSWLFRYTLLGKPQWMGLGPYPAITLASARLKAADARTMVANKVDPIATRDALKAQSALDAAKLHTFDQCAALYIKAHRAGWRNSKHADQWQNTIATYCSKIIGALPVNQIDTGLVLRVLEPIWASKRETAGRLRGRIESILDWARVRGFREGDNPARWRGHLDQTLPPQQRQRSIKHHPALPFGEVGAFMEALRAEEGAAARALEFAILTAARTGEIIGARWEEVDMSERTWTIPGARMKARREHRVPLSQPATALLRKLHDNKEGDYVFPGRTASKPLSNMAMLALLKRMKRSDVTTHGFRSSFRDWAAERTSYPREVCEMALAHAVSDQVEAAYRRGDLFDKRRRLMGEWAKHCENTAGAGKVVSISRPKQNKTAA